MMSNAAKNLDIGNQFERFYIIILTIY